MESIIRDKVIEHFTVNKLFTNRQFGFLKGCSAITQLLQILDDWTDLHGIGHHNNAYYTVPQKSPTFGLL